MPAAVRFTDDPAHVLAEAGTFLASDPVRHNLILTLLHGRVAHPEPGRYWIVTDGEPIGVVFQSPLEFWATTTPMPDAAARAVVDSVVDAGVALPGVMGPAAAAACFAGHWTERTRSGARPVSGQRLYEVDEVVDARPTTGGLRFATAADRELVIAWFVAFAAEIGDPPRDPADAVDRRIAAGEIWLWDDHGPVALSGSSQPVAAAVRVGPVFTPPERRGNGYASALVAAQSHAARAEGHRCILYTDLENPTSNAIYRGLGYRAVMEVTRYEFAGAATAPT